MTTLYIQDHRGAVRVWSARIEGDELVMQHGHLDGALQEKRERVPAGKGGRSQAEQMQSRLAARVNRQHDRGYRPELPTGKPVNSLALPKPMLAQTLAAFPAGGGWIQPKLDGVRCLFTRRNGEALAYSRGGKPLPGAAHLIPTLDLREGEVLDGELYIHGMALQTISGLARKESTELGWVGYDMVSDRPYRERLALLKDRAPVVVPTHAVVTEGAAQEAFAEFRAAGYEGAILRHSEAGYEDGKRSRTLLKLKAWEDAEFLILAVEPSEDGVPVLVLRLPSGDTFKAVAPGTAQEKAAVLADPAQIIGRYANVTFAQWSLYGVPMQPTVRGLRA